MQVKPLFKIEKTSIIKPPLASKRVSVKVALELIHDEDYYQEVMEAGMDPMYAYRYLNWRLNCPHRPARVKRFIKQQNPSPQVVFNFLGDYLVDQFGTGSVEDNEYDVRGELVNRIFMEGRSWGHWPKAPSVGDWVPYCKEKDTKEEEKTANGEQKTAKRREKQLRKEAQTVKRAPVKALTTTIETKLNMGRSATVAGLAPIACS